MEIRCDKCTHVGPAAEVRPGEAGVVLVCENCGHENLLDVGGSKSEDPGGARQKQAEATPAESPAPAFAAAHSSGGARGREGRGFGDKEDVRVWLQEDALEALIPDPGPGPRCPKCARRVSAQADHCSRCGLDLREAQRYEPGEAPWQQPPAGKEAEQEQALLLWRAFEDQRSTQALEKFVHFVRDEGLLDLGVRKLRFYMVDHPDDERAVEHLRDLAESLQSRIIIAQVQAQASADEFQQGVSRFKQRVMFFALAFFGGIFLLFLALFWDNCSRGIPSL